MEALIEALGKAVREFFKSCRSPERVGRVNIPAHLPAPATRTRTASFVSRESSTPTPMLSTDSCLLDYNGMAGDPVLCNMEVQDVRAQRPASA